MFPRHPALLCALLTTMAAACSAPEAVSPGKRPAAAVIRIAHAWGEEGAPFPTAFRDALGHALPGVRIEMVSSAAGVTNLLMLQRGDVDAASTYADIAYMASVGMLPAMPKPFEAIRAIASLPVRELQVVVAPGSPVRSIGDLRGRRVSLGPAGTGVALTAQLLLSAFGIDRRDVTVRNLEFDEAVGPLMQGDIDAVFWGGRVPNPNIAAATSRGARLLQIVGPEIDRFRAEYPFLRATMIPTGTYPAVDRAVHTVGVDAIFVCRVGLDERLVHGLTTAFFQAVIAAGRHVRILRTFNLGRAAAAPLPLHPGAARYYRELEMRR